MLQEITFRLQIANKEVERQFREALTSLEGCRIGRPDDQTSVDVLVFELGVDPAKDFHLVQSLLTLGSVREVFLTSPSSDPAILVQSMRVGAKEFFVQPVNPEEVRQALARLKDRLDQSDGSGRRRNGRIIDVIGAKGGVGTTTIAVNVATALASGDNPRSVVLLDKVPLFGEVPLFLEIDTTHHWGEIVKNISRLDATFLTSILSKHVSGAYVLPSPSRLDGEIDAAREAIDRLLRLLQTLFDFIVIDGGQQLDEVSLKILDLSHTVLLVSVPSLPCLANANRLLKSFHDLGYAREKSKVVINRYLKNPDVPLKDIENSLRTEAFCVIPNDYRSTMSSINQGKPLAELLPKKPVTRSIQELAASLCNLDGEGAGVGL
jgi:pilus assembly protein CpaE